jgi:hypothetical protein
MLTSCSIVAVRLSVVSRLKQGPRPGKVSFLPLTEQPIMGLPGLAQCVASRATLGEGWSGRPAPSPNPAPALPFGRSNRSGSASKHAGAGLLDRLSVVRKEGCAFEGARVRRGRATAIVCAVPVAGSSRSIDQRAQPDYAAWSDSLRCERACCCRGTNQGSSQTGCRKTQGEREGGVSLR